MSPTQKPTFSHANPTTPPKAEREAGRDTGRDAGRRAEREEQRRAELAAADRPLAFVPDVAALRPYLLGVEP